MIESADASLIGTIWEDGFEGISIYTDDDGISLYVSPLDSAIVDIHRLACNRFEPSSDAQQPLASDGTSVLFTCKASSSDDSIELWVVEKTPDGLPSVIAGEYRSGSGLEVYQFESTKVTPYSPCDPGY